MAQVTETVARGILAGHGYTDNEVRQLAHHWLASHGQAPAQAAPAAVAGPSADGLLGEIEDWLNDLRQANFSGYVPQNVFSEAGDFVDRIEQLRDPSAPTTQPAPQQEARPVTPYTCPKCHALWLHWPAEQSGFGMDTLNCRSTTHCDYCEKGGVEQLERLERVPAALKAPQQEAQEPVGYTHASWIAEAKRGGGGSFVGRKNAAFDVPIYTAPPHSPAAQGDALDAARWYWLAAYLVGPRADLDDAIVASETVDDLKKLVDAARAAQEEKKP